MSGTVVFEDAKLQAVELIAETVTLNNFSVSTATTFQQTTNASNVTTNTLRFTNPATAFVTTGNVEVGTANLFVDTTTGRVGIGTVSPFEKLDVHGVSRISSAYPRLDFFCTTGRSTNAWGNSTGAAGDYRIYSNSDASDATKRSLNFDYGQNTTHTTRMCINAAGNVGIGTTSPTSMLELAANGGSSMITLKRTNTSNGGAKGGIRFTENTNGYNVGVIACLGDGANTSGALCFYTKASSTETGVYLAASDERMRISSSGNVGIGTATFTDTRNTGGLHIANSKGISFAASTNSGSRHWRIRTDDYSDHGSLQISVSDNNSTHPDANDEHVMTMNRARNVGIGTAYPATSFHVYRNTDHDHLLTIEGKTTSGDDDISGGISFKHTSGHATGYRGITWYNTNNNNFLMGGVTMAVGGGYNNCRIAFHAARNKASGDTVRAYIDSYGTGGDLNFTGQHRCFIKEIPFTQIENVEGLIVSADNNKYIKMSDGIEAGSNAITTNESLPVVSLSNVATDKKCFGVISASEDPESRQDRYGNIVSVFEKEKGDTRVYINSVGEGAVWITNINGNLESGDYITTSNVTGYGMKQDSEFLANYTVAKITMDCDFEPVTQPVQQIVKELSNVNYWVETTYTDVELEEYSNLTEENRRTVTDNEIVTYQKIERTESTTEREGWALDVRQELVNVLDEHGQLQWEDHPTETEKAYKIRYLTSDGQITDESNAVHIAAFVGCTYHCG